MAAANRVSYIYNPHQQSKEELIERFSVRRRTFEKLSREIKTSSMKYPEQHYLIQGLRGMGKTTLLLRLNYEIENDEKLNTRIIPIIFKEEVHRRIIRLYKLWEEIAKTLESKDVSFKGISEEMESRYHPGRGEDDYERECYDILSRALDRREKKIILFIDNLNHLFAHFNDDLQNHRLREILMTSPYLRIIGASAEVLEAHFRYRQPWFEFFQIITLEGLNSEETQSLLKAMGKIYHEEEVIKNILENQPERVETLRILTGGVIRTIIIFFDILIAPNDGETLHDLEKILDEVTPLYMSRLDHLSPHEQAVVDAVAFHWDAVTVECIVRKIRMDTNDVLDVLNSLERKYLIERVSLDVKTQYYRLKERFFNIWYLMRMAPKNSKTQVIWLVRFFENWYSKRELDKRLNAFILRMEKGEYDQKSASLLAETYTHEDLIKSRSLPPELVIKIKTLSASPELRTEKLDELINNLKEVSTGYAGIITKYIKMYGKANALLFALGDINVANERYGEAEEYYLQAVNKGISDAMLKVGFLYEDKMKDFAMAERYYLMAVEKENVEAMNKLGILYRNNLKDNTLAETFFLRAVQKCDPEAMYNIGHLYQYELKNNSRAEHYYLMAVEKGHLGAMNSLGLLYQTAFQDYANAEKYYKKAGEKGHAGSLIRLAWLYFEQKTNRRKALALAERAVEKNRNNHSVYVLSCIYLWNNRIDDALEIAKQFMVTEKEFDEEGVYTFYLSLLLAKEQYGAAAEYFNDSNLRLKERLKPLYYAYLFLIKDAKYQIVPYELSETMQAIVDFIRQLAKDYGNVY